MDASARFLAAIVESSDDAIITKNLDGIITSWNRAAERIFGYTASEIVGRSILTIIPPERHGEEVTILGRLRRGERMEHFETVRVRKNGSPVDVALTISPIKDDAGKVVGASKILRDVTDRRRLDAAIKASEHQLKLITDAAPVFLLRIDVGSRYTFANRPYAERYGLKLEEVIGRTVPEVVGIEAYRHFRPLLEQAFQGRRLEYELEIPYAKLGLRWVQVVYVPDIDPSGRVIGVVAVINDITERKRIEQEVERARDAALTASKAKDDFLAALSHELRTPLSPILLLATEAASDPTLPPAVREHFDLIAKNAVLEARLIDDLLDVTRISRGKLRLAREMHDLRKVLEDAIETVRADFAAKKIALTVDLAAGGCEAWIDAVRLQQVAWNILKNALKFTPEGGAVAVRSAVQEGEARIVVTDSGIGLTPEELGRIFHPFVQGEHAAEGAHRYGGLGLGLAISRMLVEQHGGTLTAASGGRDQGAAFTIALPLAPRSAGEPAAVEASLSANGLAT